MILRKILDRFFQKYQTNSSKQKSKQKVSSILKTKHLLVIGLFVSVLFLPLITKAEAGVIPPTILKPESSEITTAKPLIAGVSLNDTVVEIYLDRKSVV